MRDTGTTILGLTEVGKLTAPQITRFESDNPHYKILASCPSKTGERRNTGVAFILHTAIFQHKASIQEITKHRTIRLTIQPPSTHLFSFLLTYCPPNEDPTAPNIIPHLQKAILHAEQADLPDRHHFHMVMGDFNDINSRQDTTNPDRTIDDSGITTWLEQHTSLTDHFRSTNKHAQRFTYFHSSTETSIASISRIDKLLFSPH